MTIRALRSLTLKQAVHAMMATFLIGLAITTAEFGWTVTRERAALLARAGEVSALVQAPASIAAWTLDGELAQQVLDGVLAGSRIIGSATVELEHGMVLARRERPATAATPAERLIARLLFTDLPTVRGPLHAPGQSPGQPAIGALLVKPDRIAAAERILDYAVTALMAGTARNLLIGLALTLVLHRLLTRPLIQIGRAIARIDTAGSRAEPLAIPDGHADDELGFVVSRLNRVFRALNREHTELQRMATVDSLTGLANRTLLTDRLGHAIELACRSRHRLAVLSVDLDRLKQVNDSLGHATGDRLLCLVARRLNETVRRCDTVGRLAGDEFLVILERVQDAQEAAAVAERLLAALSAPAELEGHRLHVSASIGIALHPDDGADARTLMRMANAAMHAAKAEGGGRFLFHTRDMTDRALARLLMESHLRDAVAASSFELVYQPKVAAQTAALTGFEALIRWRHEGTLISPADFIPLAEETGLIIDIGAWVLDEACRTAGRWARLHGPMPVAVNVSARQLADPGFPRAVEDALRRNGTQPNLLEIEITETVIMKDVRHHLPTLNRLRALGVRIAVDDFGTGYSSLAYLRQLPVDVLKIDRSFVSDLPGEPDIASTVIALAQRLFLTTVAEGVETEAQHAWLRDAGCDCVQGYLISRPVTADAAEAMVMASFARDDSMALTA